MPRYDMECTHCDTEFEIDRPLADFDKAIVCPTCDTAGPAVVLLAATPGKVIGGTPTFHR